MPASRFVSLFAVSGLIALAGCGSSDEGGSGSGTDQAGPSGATETVKVFSTEGEQFNPVEREVPAAEAPEAAAEALLEVPADRTYIPRGTEVEGVKVNGDGEAVIDFSERFLGGIPAAPEKRTRREQEAVEGRVAQVTYTLTSLKRVDEVKVKSGGLTVSAPKQREDFAEPEKKPAPPGEGGRYGVRSTGAIWLQQKLADLGYLPQSGVDGVVGYQTEQAVMAFQSWEGLARDGVAGPATRAELRTAKRPRPSAKRPRRLMEVRIGRGVLMLVRNGRAVRTIHISAGSPGNDTPTGRYEVFRKELMSWSVPFSTWLPYASYFNNGIAFHEYPDVPPYPASHGCVRVPAPEAPLVYKFARLGTVVVVRS
ncbi:MAG: peptidoglycan-binding protein [Solirubrobacterales bacterium]|nr:peptidoglycan-binding protein [Solirubrobacterales bacterium]